jgi:hypothetical protein
VVIVILVIALGALGVGIFSWMSTEKLKSRFTAALGGERDESLESTLAAHIASVRKVGHRLEELESEYQRLAITNELASQKISIVRFNPFGDTGGDQSFSLAVLDAHNSGYVLTSIHGRQGTRVYVKPVDFGKSKYTLSSEEQQSLGQAIKRVPDPDITKEKSHGTKIAR